MRSLLAVVKAMWNLTPPWEAPYTIGSGNMSTLSAKSRIWIWATLNAGTLSLMISGSRWANRFSSGNLDRFGTSRLTVLEITILVPGDTANSAHLGMFCTRVAIGPTDSHHARGARRN